jgi:hypothetical protein
MTLISVSTYISITCRTGKEHGEKDGKLIKFSAQFSTGIKYVSFKCRSELVTIFRRKNISRVFGLAHFVAALFDVLSHMNIIHLR